MKSFVAVSSVVVLIAAQFICETQGLPMRPVTLKETGGMKFKDAKTKGSARWESLLAKMKNGASNGVVGSKLNLLGRPVDGCLHAGRVCDNTTMIDSEKCCAGYICEMPGSANSKRKGRRGPETRCMPDHEGETLLGKKAAKLSGAKMAKKD
eukprot:648941_1